MCVADGERIKPELVGEADADLLPADGDVRNLAQRHALEHAKVEALGNASEMWPRFLPIAVAAWIGLATAQ